MATEIKTIIKITPRIANANSVELTIHGWNPAYDDPQALLLTIDNKKYDVNAQDLFNAIRPFIVEEE